MFTPGVKEEEEEEEAAGLSAMETEFREIDENGSWSAIYQVGTSPQTMVEKRTVTVRPFERLCRRRRRGVYHFWSYYKPPFFF